MTTDTKTDTTELVLGKTYTDRFKQITGPAMEIHASEGGCYLVGIQLPPKDGEPGKLVMCFDTHLDDTEGNPVRRPDAMAARFAEVIGRRYTDPSSGFTGTCTGLRVMENGTEQLGIQPHGDGKEFPNAYSLDSNKLHDVSPSPVESGARVGPPASAMPRF